MTQVVILDVTIEAHQPLTWRRLAVSATITYPQLNHLIQVAFGWYDEPLYLFRPAWNSPLSYENVKSKPFPGDAEDGTDIQILPG